MQRKKLERLGEKHITNEGYEIEIIEYFNKKECSIIFINGTILKNRKYKDIAEGRVKNPYHPSIYGIGYFGEGIYKTKIEDKSRKAYSAWNNMLKRCYTEIHHLAQPSYAECSVVEGWHNFQVFAEWFEENYIEDFALDKDILIKGNKVYSPETCCFVPMKINSLFTKRQNDRGSLPLGVRSTKGGYVAQISINKKVTHLGTFSTPEEAFQAYKAAKERYIKEIANSCKSEIRFEVYSAMCNYKVEITD